MKERERERVGRRVKVGKGGKGGMTNRDKRFAHTRREKKRPGVSGKMCFLLMRGFETPDMKWCERSKEGRDDET